MEILFFMNNILNQSMLYDLQALGNININVNNYAFTFINLIQGYLKL